MAERGSNLVGPAPPSRPWLTVVGIGEDGIAGLSPRAAECIRRASTIFGGKRHLQLAAPLIRGEASPWPTPFGTAIGQLLARRGEPVCVLASGDPMLFGIGATIARSVPAEEMEIIPAPSSFSLAAARMGWPLAEVETLSLHGRSLDLIRPLLHAGRRLLLLTSDAETPAAIAVLMSEAGFGPSRITLLEALGGPDERVRAAEAKDFGLGAIHPLNLLAVEVRAGRQARIIPLTAGRSEDLFEHDGQITKYEVRAVVMALLAPRRGEYLWDVGAGSGSIGVEWMLAHPSMRCTAVEAKFERAERIGRNAARLGVPGLQIVEAAAPAALVGLAAPDAIFIGGGATVPGVIDHCMEALRSGGRLAVTAVTLETESLLASLHGVHGGQLLRVEISRAEPLGSMTGWRPSRPVAIWSWTKS
ncbi:MAG TPA: precorrin-6y C5,15-methyltransferase (decarboxylating) subunit CbiE [Rhizorhapis sp.]|nr:precorrin-6y C5,15-methyltransferase (decarboxylating) subunit CbiE [Rhizorhapis sp.]